MNKKIISGNWKMNGSLTMINQWFEDFTKNANNYEKENSSLNNDTIPLILVCVPDIYIDYMTKKTNEYNGKMSKFKIYIGTENIYSEENGAFTGNTSPLFLNEFGCQYTLVGHSERRQYHHETNEEVSKKAICAIAHKITPLICVGENLEIRESNKHLDFVGQQVLESTNGVDIKNAIIAYEPVWAIGTGKVPTENEIDEMNGHIKTILNKEKNIDIEDIKVVYGGSVKSSNAKNILSLNNTNGVLVGGASMKGEEFFNIVKASL